MGSVPQEPFEQCRCPKAAAWDETLNEQDESPDPPPVRVGGPGWWGGWKRPIPDASQSKKVERSLGLNAYGLVLDMGRRFSRRRSRRRLSSMFVMRG